jgi:hypothetical protein
MEPDKIAEPTQTYCAHCKKDVVPRVVEDGTEQQNAVDLIGLKHARSKAGHHYHGECSRCHHPLFSPVAEDANKQESRFDWQTLLFMVGGIAFMIIVYFAFNR